MNELDELIAASKACADRLQELCDTRLRGREAADAREEYQRTHAALLRMVKLHGMTPRVSPNLVQLSARASENWCTPRSGLDGGILLGGPAVQYTTGAAQRQIAGFSIPRLPDDDPRDPGDMQIANTLLAVECVRFVRGLIAREVVLAPQAADDSDPRNKPCTNAAMTMAESIQ